MVVESPKPLRVLYTESAIVALARVVETVEVKKGEDSAAKRTTLRISTLLKGESKKRVLSLNHDDWQEAEGYSPNRFEKDDVLLVFLTLDEEGVGYVPTDMQRGLKKLSPDDLKVYLSRIEELAAIMRSEKPDPAELAEWLVRCAEEPATRWEGAYDLAPGDPLFVDTGEDAHAESGQAMASAAHVEVAAADTNAEQAKQASDAAAVVQAEASGAANPKGDDESGDQFELDEEVRSSESAGRTEYATLLTPAQKERLTIALLNAEELDEGALWLVRLVGRWKDARLVPFSLKHLAGMAEQPLYQGEDLMRVVAHTLADQTLVKFAADYSVEASYIDFEADENATNEAEDGGQLTAEARAAARKELEERKAAALEARFERSGKLRQFLALAAQPQKP